MREIKTPFLVVNPKSYLYGEESLKLARASQKAHEETGLDVYFTCPHADIRYIAHHTQGLVITAQHMDSLRPGRGMGKVLPESLKEAGAEAVFLNHAENSLTVAELYACIKRAKELEMISIVCADSVAEGKALAEFAPDVLLCEPTDLIGTGKVADDNYTIEAIKQIKGVNKDVKVMIASGISTADDVYNVIKLGADATGATSGILKAPDSGQMVMDMAKAMLRAYNERK